ncbi:hypothetical protein LCGC14_2482100, partial [marine sediment metagenome]
QKPAIPDTRAITLNVDMNSQSGTHGLVINMVATQLAAGEIISLFDLEIDASNATGGHVHAMEMSQVGGNAIDIVMLHANPNIGVIHHDSGSFGNVETAFKYTGSWTDTTAAFNDAGTDVELFSADTDIVYIGMAATFDHVEAILATFASGPGIKPAFAFSDGVGGFTAFTPEDGTRGFRDSGIIEWHTPDLVGWSTDTVNSIGSKYWIRITRTHGGSITAPIEDTVQVQAVTNYSWDKDGNLSILKLTFDDVSLSRGAANRLDLATGDNLRIVSGALEFSDNVKLSNPSSGILRLEAGDTLQVDTLAETTADGGIIVDGLLLKDSIVAGASDNLGFYGTTAVALQTGVTVDAAGIHAALVNLGLITA